MRYPSPVKTPRLTSFVSLNLFVALGLSVTGWAQDAPQPDAAPAASPATADSMPMEQPSTSDPSDVSEVEGADGVDGAAEASVSRQRPEGQEDGATTENLNSEGGIGYQRIATAKGGGAMTFRAAFFGSFYVGDDAIREGSENTLLTGQVLLQGTLSDYFSVNLGLAARNNYNSFGRPQAMLSQGDLNLGVRGFYPVNDVLSIGGDLSLFFPSDFGGTGFDLSSTSVRPRLIGSLDLQEATDGSFPLNAHLNLGYRVDNSENGVPENARLTRVERFAYGVSEFDGLEVGVGVDMEFSYVRPFLAYSMTVPLGDGSPLCGTDTSLDCLSDAGFAAYPKLLSLGAKIEPLTNLGLHASLDLGLASAQAQGVPVTAPYTVNLGLSWTIDPTPQVEYIVQTKEKVVEKEKVVDRTPTRGYVKGVVIDSVTEKPIKGAVVEYVNTGLNAQVSAMTDGTFRSYGFGPGSEVTMIVKHPDYKQTEVITTLTEGDQDVRVKMEAIPKKAFVTGKILDVKGKPISNAVVTVSGSDAVSKGLPVDAAGQFNGQVMPGKLQVAVKAQGYLTKGRSVELENEEKLNMEFVLVERPKKVLAKLRDKKIEILDKVFFAKGKSEILSKSFPLLDTIASILAENPQVKQVRVEGHTDDTGNLRLNMELSQARAQAVRNYLVKAGVSVNRLQAKGYGPSEPLVPNSTRRNRTLNRRVEFDIVQTNAPATSPTVVTPKATTP